MTNLEICNMCARIKRLISMFFCVVMAVGLAGCGKQQDQETDIIVNTVDTEKQKPEVKSDTGSGEEMEYVTVEEFLKYYNASAEEMDYVDLEGMIWYCNITASDLEEGNWLDTTKLYAGKEFCIDETYMTNSLNGGTRKATEQDDFRSAEYMYYTVDTLYSDGMMYKAAVFIDIENKTVYYSTWQYLNCQDLTDAEIVKEISDDEINKIISKLTAAELYALEDKKQYFCSEADEYVWDLYIMMKPGDVIRHRGNVPGNESETKFNDVHSYIKTLCE